MNIKRVTMPLALIAVLVLVNAGPSRVLAQQNHMQMMIAQNRDQEGNSQASALIRAVRQATERFQDVSAAQAAGYYLQFGCVSGSDSGAMGMHFVNSALVTDGVLD